MSEAKNMGKAMDGTAAEEWAVGDSSPSLPCPQVDSVIRMIERAASDLRSLDFEVARRPSSDGSSIAKSPKQADAEALDFEDDVDAVIRAYHQWVGGGVRQHQ